MAYVNLPPNLQDMFYALSDRIAKLETGPNQPGYDADAAQSTAVSAQGVANQATIAANLANTQATTAIALANTKNTVFYSGSAPTANAVNDQWINTAAGNKLYIWNGSSWISAQDSAITAAQSTANGKNAIYRQGTTPTTPYTGTSFVIGDMWFNTSSDNAISTWNGTSWGSNALGDSALYGNISANKLTSGTIDASVINVSNINAGNISTGTLSASRIATGSLNGNVITSNTITATQIAAGTITATEISSSYVYAGTISANNITTGTLSATVSLNAQSGTVGGFTITSTNIYTANLNIASSGTISGGNSQTIYYGYGNFGGGSNTGGYRLYVTGTSGLIGDTTVTGYIYNPGYATTVSAANAYINSSTGLLARSSSSLRYKVDAQPQTIPVQSILQLTPKSFFDKAQADEKGTTNGLPRILGLIAEEVAQIPVIADFLMNKNDQGEPDSVNYDRVAIALLPLLQDHEARLNKLEGK
jgi:hypothetical protein